MTPTSRRCLIVCLLMLSIAVPVLAHHSVQAEFKINNKTTITGVLTKIEWINPHSYFYVDVKDEKGNVTNYVAESYPTGFFHRAGITRDMFHLGDTVTVVLFLAKDPSISRTGWMHELTLANGRTITFDNNDEKQ